MVIGSYSVLFELARGGMGTVFLARAVGAGGIERLVAIKRPHEEVTPGKDGAARFLDEARITAQVHHANVVGVHQVGSDDAGPYLVFDYVEGESLDGLAERARAQGARVPPRIVFRIVLDALSGLHAAHETTDAAGQPLGVLHRDVSVQNLLVGRDGVTRLTDFGIAKSALSSTVTAQGYVQGKLLYMAPEYLQRLPVDRTLDIYAMGMTLFVALTGTEPWPGADHAQVIQSALMRGVPPLSSAGVELPADLEALVLRASSRDAGHRFQSARAMQIELDETARKHGMLANHVEVAEYVEGLAGKDLAVRREAIRARREAAPVEATRGTNEPRASRRALVVGAVLALVAGSVALWVVRSAGPAPPRPLRDATRTLASPSAPPSSDDRAVRRPPETLGAADAGRPATKRPSAPPPAGFRRPASPTAREPGTGSHPDRFGRIAPENPYPTVPSSRRPALPPPR